MNKYKKVISLSALLIASTNVFSANNESAIGINLTGLSYWSSQWLLVDAMKHASNGREHIWSTSNSVTFNIDTYQQDELELDANGWPMRLPQDSSVGFDHVTTIIYQDNEHYPIGNYTILYEGEGELGFDGVGVVSKKPGEIVVSLEANKFFHLKILESDPHQNGNYIKNIRVILPGGICSTTNEFAESVEDCASENEFVSLVEYSESNDFHPLALKDLKHYRSIRFMEFLRTVANPIEHWEQRTMLSHASWKNVLGSPIEVAIDLANKLKAEPWLNIPVRVNDDYVREYAELVKQKLSPGLTAYFEFGNEIWNDAYPFVLDANYITEKGRETWPNANVSSNEYRLNFQGRRSSEVCSIIMSVFGEDSERVQCVVGGMSSNVWSNRQVLTCPVNVAFGGEACHPNIDALAIAPYFGGYLSLDSVVSQLSNWSDMGPDGLDLLFQELQEPLLHELTYDPNLHSWEQASSLGALPEAREHIRENVILANEFQLPLLAYEGGQHLTYAGALSGDRGKINEALFIPANRDPRMGQAFTQHLSDWKELGGGFYMIFESVGQFGAYGAFALKEYQNQPLVETPKYVAVTDFISNNPCWWEHCELENLLSVSVHQLFDSNGLRVQWDARGSIVRIQVLFDEKLIFDGSVRKGTDVKHDIEVNWLDLTHRYSIQVIGLNEHDQEIASYRHSTFPGDQVLPTSPTGLEVILSSTEHVSMQWEPSEDNHQISHYEIFKNGTHFTHVFGSEFAYDWPEIGEHRFNIRAVDVAGNKSELSDSVTILIE